MCYVNELGPDASHNRHIYMIRLTKKVFERRSFTGLKNTLRKVQEKLLLCSL
jgi:hypothetical protein